MTDEEEGDDIEDMYQLGAYADDCYFYATSRRGYYGYDDRDEEVSFPLTVHQTPCQVLGKGIELVLQNQEVMFGDSATFRLRLRDDTGEAGEWTRDDVTLTHSEKTQISINGRDRQLTLTDVHPPDTGEYAYRVGEDRTSAHLSINKANCFCSVQHPPPPPNIPI
ncbi:obscurin-like [Haliotis rufescens]|uniref:obscurin-like n=1 Tax=Haliotis rufescens TaxID=6454 RepID=UPI00201EA176|nr:obscurin-like [Haliotis rufescens]